MIEKERMRPRRVGIAGAGYISDFHIRALRETRGVEITAICEPDPNRGRAAQRRWGLPDRFESVSEMLRSKSRPDVVHVLTPPAHHAGTAIACLEAGCDVFLEKPAATSAEECASMLRSARRLGRVVGVNHNARFHPAFERLKKHVRDWRLGDVQHVAAGVNVPLRQLASGQHGHWMFREPANIVLEQAPHPLSQIQALLGSFGEISVLCSGRTRLNTGKVFYDTWQISMICERGTAQCFLSFGREHAEQWLHAVGQDGAAFLDLRRNTIQKSEKTRFIEPADALLNGLGAAATLVGAALGNFTNYGLSFLRLRTSTDPFAAGMRGSIRGFYGALASGRPLPVDLEQASEVIQVCQRIGEYATTECEEKAAHAANV